MTKKIHVLGGGTRFYIRPHLALSAPAGGKTARWLHKTIAYWPNDLFQGYEVNLHLTRMAGGNSNLDMNADVARLVDELVADPDTKIIFFNVAMCDFEAHVLGPDGTGATIMTPSGKDQPRLKSRADERPLISLTPAEKVIGKIRETRKDIFLVGFKTTAGATENEQFLAGLKLCKEAHCNLVVANDIQTKINMIVTPEQSRYGVKIGRAHV